MENKKGFGRPKTQEELQAQIENFAEQKLPPIYTNEEKLFMKAAQFAKEHFFDFDQAPQGLEIKNKQAKEEQHNIFQNSSELAKINDIHNLPDNISPDLKELVLKLKDEYLLFSKEQNIATLRFQAECIKRYEEDFESLVNNIILQIQRGIKIEDIEGYIASGDEANVFKITTSSGIYAIKIYKTEWFLPSEGLEAMRRARSIENVSHLKAYSQKDRVMVMEFINGKSLYNTPMNECPVFTNQELEKFLDTIFELYKNGIAIDVNPKNFIYDNKTKNINIIDYYIDNKVQSLFEYIRDLPSSLSFREESPVIATKSTMEEYDKYKLRVKEMNLRIIDTLTKNFPEFCNEYKKDIENWKNSI
ncbi:hypothetical protein IT400_02940 [Candidatus Nomurabacteria bacterium]|nr:hypothetical protein [Candidatus Nomurabacteria bacterium]